MGMQAFAYSMTSLRSNSGGGEKADELEQKSFSGGETADELEPNNVDQKANKTRASDRVYYCNSGGREKAREKH